MSPTAKFWQGLSAVIGVLPSGLWQRRDSGTPFTLEEDPPCGDICASTEQLLISDGNHEKEPYKKAAKFKKNPLKTPTQSQFTFLLSSYFHSCFLTVHHHHNTSSSLAPI